MLTIFGLISIIIICYLIREKQKMDELYTFNSNQLEISARRPASTDNPLCIRKRIIKSILSKKQSHFADSPQRSREISTAETTSRHTPKKRVRFNIDTSTSCGTKKGLDEYQMTKKVMALKRSEVNACVADMLLKKLESSRYALQDIKNQKTVRKTGKRSLSNAEGSRQIVSMKNEEIANTQGRSLRQRRILSLKLSPKIVPISDDRLPKAFKVKYIGSDNLRQSQKKNIKLREILSCEIDKKMKEQERVYIANDGVSKLQRLLAMEKKIFSALHHLRQ